MKPKQFGRRPILMQRWDGGLRIIQPNGKVDWDDAKTYSVYTHSCIFESKGFKDGEMFACTSAETQEQAFKNCVKYDNSRIIEIGCRNFSKFLGYL